MSNILFAQSWNGVFNDLISAELKLRADVGALDLKQMSISEAFHALKAQGYGCQVHVSDGVVQPNGEISGDAALGGLCKSISDARKGCRTAIVYLSVDLSELSKEGFKERVQGFQNQGVAGWTSQCTK